MVPGALDRDAGRVVPDQEAARPRLGVVGAGPDRHPAQPVGAGGEDLPAADRPAPPAPVLRATVLGRPPRAGVPSSGSTRSALISTGACDRLGQGRPVDVVRPGRRGRLGGVREQRHRGDQGHRRVTAAERAEDARGVGQPAARAAVAAGDGRGEQPGLVDDADALGREVGGPVVALGVRRQGAGDLGQPVQVGGRNIDYIDGHNRHYAGAGPAAPSAPSRVKSAKSKPGATTQLTRTSDAAAGRADCQWPAGMTCCGRWPPARSGPRVATAGASDGVSRVAAVEQGERAAGMPEPDLVRPDPMPGGLLAGRQQEVDAGGGGPRARVAVRHGLRGGAPRLPEPAALGVRAEIEQFGRPRPWSLIHAATMPGAPASAGRRGRTGRGWR